MLTVKKEDGKLNIRYHAAGKSEQQISIPAHECEHIGALCDEAHGLTTENDMEETPTKEETKAERKAREKAEKQAAKEDGDDGEEDQD